MLDGAFAVDDAELEQTPIVIIDDVLSTGSTLAAAATALRNAGATRVYAATLAFAGRGKWVLGRLQTQGLALARQEMNEWEGDGWHWGLLERWAHVLRQQPGRGHAAFVELPTRREQEMAPEPPFLFAIDKQGDHCGIVRFTVVADSSLAFSMSLRRDSGIQTDWVDGWVSWDAVWGGDEAAIAYRTFDHGNKFHWRTASMPNPWDSEAAPPPFGARALLSLARALAREAPMPTDFDPRDDNSQ